jgi:hypothetical protein
MPVGDHPFTLCVQKLYKERFSTNKKRRSGTA